MVVNDALLDALSAEITNNTGDVALVTEYVAVAAFTDRNGDQHVYTVTLEDQRHHTTMGLLDFALTAKRAEVRRDIG